MNYQLLSPIKRTFAFIAIFAILFSGIVAIANVKPSSAAANVTCSISASGAGQCSVAFNDTIDTGGSNTGGGGGAGGGGAGGGSGGGGGGNPSLTSSGWSFVRCSGWGKGSPSTGAGWSSGTYPVENPTTCRIIRPRTIDGRLSSEGVSCSPSNGKAATGIYNSWRLIAGVSQTILGEDYRCVYPSDPPRATVSGSAVCTTRIDMRLFYSTNIAAVQGGGISTVREWVPAFQRNVDPNNIPGTCDSRTSVPWNVDLPRGDDGQSLRGYYKINADRTAIRCTQYSYPSWTQAPSYWTCGGTVRDSNQAYATNTCTSGIVDGLISGARFDVSDCASERWTCTTGDTQIAAQLRDVSVMRNGEDVPVRFGGLSVSGPGVRNIDSNSIQVINRVDGNSTPYNRATGVNGSQQYFDYVNSGRSLEFDRYYNLNTLNNPALRYFWASDLNSRWTMTSQYRFDAEFLVTVSDTLGGGSTQRWVRDTQVECGDIASAPNVVVQRSINAP